MWRKNCHVEKFGLFIKNLNKLSKFMPFLFKIYVEKNLRGENLCGEKMTHMRSEYMTILAGTWVLPMPDTQKDRQQNIELLSLSKVQSLRLFHHEGGRYHLRPHGCLARCLNLRWTKPARKVRWPWNVPRVGRPGCIKVVHAKQH